MKRLAVTGVMLAFAALTNVWPGMRPELERANDVPDYEPIAVAAPSFPAEPIGTAHAQRFVVHYATGLLSDATGWQLHRTYEVVWTVCVALLVLVLHVLLVGMGLSLFAYSLCMALVLLNPYALRPYAIAPGMLTDLVFVLGLALSLLGLRTWRTGLVVLGAATSILGRQTELVVLPALAVVIIWGTGWRDRPLARRVVSSTAVVLVAGGLYAAVSAISRSFSDGFQPEFPRDTILPLFGSLPGTFPKLAAHVLKVEVPLLMSSFVLLVAIAAVGISRRRLAVLPLEFWTFLLIAAAVVGQPLLISPDFPGLLSNEQRLSALGLVPVVMAVACVLARLEHSPSVCRSGPQVAMIAVLVAVASLHHFFTVVGPPNRLQFLLLEGVASALVALLLSQRYRAYRRAANLELEPM